MHIISPREVVQPMLPFREARMRQVVQATIPRRRAAGKPRQHPSAMSDDWRHVIHQLDLDLPLFNSAGTVFDATYEVLPAAEASKAQAPQAHLVPDNFEDLTEQHVAMLHAKLLYRQLEQLFYARDVAGDLRREILEWVYQPAYLAHERADGSSTTIAAADVPFTFDACCFFEEIDAHALREAIARRIDQLAGSRALLDQTK